MQESQFIVTVLILIALNYLQWIDRKKQQSIIRNFKSGNQVTHTEVFLFGKGRKA